MNATSYVTGIKSVRAKEHFKIQIHRYLGETGKHVFWKQSLRLQSKTDVEQI